MLKKILEQIDAKQDAIRSYRPFEDAGLLRQLQSFYRVGIVYSSNALEGYTYTLSETKILLEDGLTAGGKSMRDALAVLGHAKAYDHMFSLLRSDVITENDVLTMHSMLGESLYNDAVVGQYRNQAAFISGSRYTLTPYDEIPLAMENLFARIAQKRDAVHPLLLAAQFHKELVFIHPFADGNGRVARLAMNTLLIQKGFLPVVIPPILRHDYIASLEKAHQNDNDFIRLIAQCELETQKEMLRLLHHK
ncbi:MAG: Fic family protein [Pseudomonadota bacterium]